MSNIFWTVKIAGVSGAGKTTLMKYFNKSQLVRCGIIIYGDLLKSLGTQQLADRALAQTLDNSQGLVLMDEHLEFDNPDKVENYQRENTKGIILLDPPVDVLIARIERDQERKRSVDRAGILRNLQLSRARANQLCKELHIVLLAIPDADSVTPQVIRMISKFLTNLSP